MASSSNMKIYKNISVFDEALNRIRYIFDEFPNVIVSVSGGKDSTVIFELALIVAREKNRLPLKVMFIDQEAEWEATIEMIKQIMYHPDVEPHWYQMPLKILNATSTTDHWLDCWGIGEKWLREKDPISIKENVYNQERFNELFTDIFKVEYPNTKSCYLGGVRGEEAPRRMMGLTQHICYKWITWGKVIDKKKQHFTFYPIYDWSYTDVWKAIHDNHWKYCKIYDVMYQYGVKVQNMRVSNVHHETAVHSLFYMQEFEPENYEKLTQRIAGIDTAGKFGKHDFFLKELPFMFKDWKEYRDYLLEKLIPDNWKESFKKKFQTMDTRYAEISDINILHSAQVQSIITNDVEFTKLENWERSPEVALWRKWYEKGETIYNGALTRLIKK